MNKVGQTTFMERVTAARQKTLATEEDFRIVRIRKGEFEVRITLPVIKKMRSETELEHAERTLSEWRKR